MALGEKILNFLSGGFAEKGVELIGKVIKDKDLAERLAAEFRTLCTTQEHELKKLVIESERDAEKEFQETIRAELAQSDEYTKRTRPKLARLSFYGAAAYISASVLSLLIVQINDVQIDWSILMVIMSPVLTYMGVRSFDKWKR